MLVGDARVLRYPRCARNVRRLALPLAPAACAASMVTYQARS